VIFLAVTGLAPARPVALAIAEPLAFAALLVAIVVARQSGRPERQRLRANFILTILIALVTALGWLASAVL
jgi:hypothetical protein